MEITLDKPRTLKFTNRSLFEIEKVLETPVFTLLQDQDRLQSTTVITTIIWAGLLHDDLKLEEVIDIVPINNFTEIIATTMAALMDAIGIDEDTKKKVAKASGTGSK